MPLSVTSDDKPGKISSREKNVVEFLAEPNGKYLISIRI